MGIKLDWYLDNLNGVKAIEWNNVKIQGENVEISGDVKINGAAIITGITNNESAQQSFNTMVANCIDATEIKTHIRKLNRADKDILKNYIPLYNKDKSLIISSE